MYGMTNQQKPCHASKYLSGIVPQGPAATTHTHPHPDARTILYRIDNIGTILVQWQYVQVCIYWLK
jgi:hypothetical protein